MTHYQVSADWHQNYISPREIEADLQGFKYLGVGIYTTATDTIVVQEDPFTGYLVHCWNCPISQTILAHTLPQYNFDIAS